MIKFCLEQTNKNKCRKASSKRIKLQNKLKPNTIKNWQRKCGRQITDINWTGMLRKINQYYSNRDYEKSADV